MSNTINACITEQLDVALKEKENKTKTANVSISARIPEQLNVALDEKEKFTGKTKTAIVTEALAAYLQVGQDAEFQATDELKQKTKLISLLLVGDNVHQRIKIIQKEVEQLCQMVNQVS